MHRAAASPAPPPSSAAALASHAAITAAVVRRAFGAMLRGRLVRDRIDRLDRRRALPTVSHALAIAVIAVASITLDSIAVTAPVTVTASITVIPVSAPVARRLQAITSTPRPVSARAL